jgi:uncharacterized protein YggT (Ycf19 family)
MMFHPRVAQAIGSALAREMEMALAPVAGTRLLAPFRMLVVSALANLVIEANQFEATAQPQDPSTVADPKAQ